MKKNKLILAVLAGMVFLSVATFAESRYFKFGHLNQGSVTVTSAWTKLKTTAGTHAFTTTTNNATIEIHVNSRFSKSNFLETARGICFQARIDDRVADYENQGALRQGENSAFLSIFAVFRNIPAGNHTVSIWAQSAPTGSIVRSVTADPGGWEGAIIVKENE